MLSDADPGLREGRSRSSGRDGPIARGAIPLLLRRVAPPYLAVEAAEWLAALGPKAVCFDFFEEYSARLPGFTSEDFRVHRAFLGNGIVMIEQATGLDRPAGEAVPILRAVLQGGRNRRGSHLRRRRGLRTGPAAVRPAAGDT